MEKMVFLKEQLRAHWQWIDHKLELHDEDNRDRISELHDSILLHIFNFMDTKSAVRTCVLSKRWKDICKCLTSLTFSPKLMCFPNFTLCSSESNGCRSESFRNFPSWVLSCRDHSCSLFNLTIESGSIEDDDLDRLMQYALLHNVQHLAIDISSISFTPNFESLPLIFCSQSLTYLKLCNKWIRSMILLPKSLQFPALKTLHLECVNFTGADNHSIEPFSECHLLNTLDLSNLASRRTQRPCFIQLKSLKVKKKGFSSLSDDQLHRVVDYLLHNSPQLASVDVTIGERHLQA
ncbi:hypothetical protein VNO78_32793 [Psophocarpus tetragonolobus]|uniref:F-box domain-containing protein n=1 Tax=Psophocarpus tetragonolobus TaxID=3891 RepID=A0AAN9RKT2_PSOTE